MTHDLDQSANVLWLPIRAVGSGPLKGGPSRHFDKLKDAIVFVMELLEPRDRGSAWITTDAASLRLDEIEAEYRKIRKPNH